jgi:hypothetical protein
LHVAASPCAIWQLRTEPAGLHLAWQEPTERFVAFTPDAAAVVSCSGTRVVRVRDIGSGALRREYHPRGGFSQMALAADGQRLVLGTTHGEVHLLGLEGDTPRRSSGPRRATAANRKKTGRNDPCPCGSGKKYSRCHGAA